MPESLAAHAVGFCFGAEVASLTAADAECRRRPSSLEDQYAMHRTFSEPKRASVEAVSSAGPLCPGATAEPHGLPRLDTRIASGLTNKAASPGAAKFHSLAADGMAVKGSSAVREAAGQLSPWEQFGSMVLLAVFVVVAVGGLAFA